MNKSGIKLADSNRIKRAKRILSKQYSKNNTVCKECGEIFPRNSDLIKHIRQKHSKEYRFSCDECNRSFVRKSQLALHQKVHTSKHPFQCQECGRRYKYRKNLYVHRRRSNHLIGDANRIDDENSEVENSLDYKISALFSMIMTGEPEEKVNQKRSNSRASKDSLNQCQPFQCDECSEGFTCRRGLAKHRRLVHTSETSIASEHHEKLFKHRKSLRRNCQLNSIREGETLESRRS